MCLGSQATFVLVIPGSHELIRLHSVDMPTDPQYLHAPGL